MRTTAAIFAFGTAPTFIVDSLTKFGSIPVEIKIDTLLRWGMYSAATLASLTAVISFIVRWRKDKL